MTDSILNKTDEAVAQLINGIYENTPQTAEYIIQTLAEGEVVMGYFMSGGLCLSIIGLIVGIVMLFRAWFKDNSHDQSHWPTLIIVALVLIGFLVVAIGSGAKRIIAPEAVVLEKLMEKM